VLGVAVVNVALNLVAIPRFGIQGSATASVIAYLISITLTVFVGRRHFQLPFPLRACLQVLLSAGAMAVVLIPFREHRAPLSVGLQIIGGATVYGLVLIASNFLELRDQLLSRLDRSEPEPDSSADEAEPLVDAPLVEVQ